MEYKVRSTPLVRRTMHMWYTSDIDRMRVLDFAQIPERCYRDQQTDYVSVEAGTFDEWRACKMRRGYGGTPLRVYFADGHHVKCVARDMTWMSTKSASKGFERITEIRVGLDLQVYDAARDPMRRGECSSDCLDIPT